HRTGHRIRRQLLSRDRRGRRGGALRRLARTDDRSETRMDIVTFVRQQWDRVAAWVAIGVGALLLLLGWLGVSDTSYPAEQLPYIISGGLGGACLIGLGAMLWLSADLRDEWSELHEIARKLDNGNDAQS